MSKKNKANESYLRLFHIACFTPSIDVYIDSKKYYKDILYEDFTKYLLFSQGEHTVTLTLHDDNTPIYERPISLSPYKIYTLIFLTDPKHNDKTGLYLIEDVQRSIPTGHCMGRIGHFNYMTSLLDFRFIDSAKKDTYKKASCYELTPYFPLPINTYTLNTTVNLTQKNFLSLKNLELKLDRFYTFYIIGNEKKETPPQILLSIDGNSYLRFIKPDEAN